MRLVCAAYIVRSRDMCRDMRTYIPALSFEHTQRAHTPSRRENERASGGRKRKKERQKEQEARDE
jgi:hypothetical protein